MNKMLRFAFLSLMVFSLSFGGSLAFAKPGGGEKGKDRGGNSGSMPSGFQKGEKKGWQGGTTPPGWSKGEKKGWKGGTTPPGFGKKSGKTSTEKAPETEAPK